jgi:hypothetical protein
LVAASEERSSSGADFMVNGDVRLAEVAMALRGVSSRLGRSINPSADLRQVLDRDLHDQALEELSATAHNTVLQLANIVIACSGYRIVGLGTITQLSRPGRSQGGRLRSVVVAALRH